MVIHGPNTDGFPVDDALIGRIEALARLHGKSPEEIIRRAIEAMESAGDSAAQSTGSPYERAVRAGLIGSVKSAAPDLSTNPAHFSGFGRD